MGHSNIQFTYSNYMHLFVSAHDMDRLDTLASASAPAGLIPMQRVGGWL